MADILRVTLLLWFWVVWTTTGIQHLCALPTTSTTTPGPIIEYEDNTCNSDLNCNPGLYCNHKSGFCAPCLDCSKYQLDPGRTECAKRKEECGSCSKGFVMDEDADHCNPDIPPSISIPTLENPTSAGGVGWPLIGVFVLVVAAIAAVGTRLIYKEIKARQSVSSPSPPEMKSLIQNGRQGGHSSSSVNNNVNSQQETSFTTPVPVAPPSAPPQHLLDHHENNSFSAALNALNNNPRVIIQEHEMQMMAKPFRRGRHAGDWRYDGGQPEQNHTQVDSGQDQMVPGNEPVPEEPDVQMSGEENIEAGIQQPSFIDQIAEILNSPPQDNRSTPTLPERRRVARTRTTRGHPYQLPNEEISGHFSSAARASASRGRQASGPSRVPSTETTRDFSSAGPSTSDLSAGPSTLSVHPPSQTQSAANTRVPTRNNSGTLNQDSGYSSSAGFLGGASMDNFVHNLANEIGQRLSGGVPFRSDWIPGPPQYNQPCSSLQVQIAKSEVSESSQYDLTNLIAQDQGLQMAVRDGAAVAGAEANAGRVEVPGIEHEEGELDADAMDVDEDVNHQRIE